MEVRIDLYGESGDQESLLGRSNAEKLMEHLAPGLKYLRDGDKVIYDFHHIVSCTTSYLDQLFTDLNKILANRSGIMIAVENIENDGVFMELDALATYLKVKKGVTFSVIYQNGRELSIIGTIDGAGKRVFQLLTERTLTARDLIDLSDGELKVNAASNQLKRLYDAGLAFRREIIDADGKKYIYYLR